MASAILYILIIIIILVIVVAAGVFSIRAAIAVKNNLQYNTDPLLQRAHKYFTIASVVCWISIAVIVLLVILYLVYGAETIAYTGSAVLVSLILILIALSGAIGVLSAIGCTSLHSSPNYSGTGDDLAAYHDGIISAVVGIASTSLFIIGFFVYLYYSSQRTKVIVKETGEKEKVVADIQAIVLAKSIEDKKLAILEARLKEVQTIAQLEALHAPTTPFPIVQG